MPYLLIENFEQGLDTRKTVFTAPPGSLRRLVNGHITRGKEIEKRKAFATYASLPADTFGLHSTRGELFVFGSAAAPTMPPTVQYQQLVPVGGSASMVRVWATENFAGGVYAVAEFDNGAVHHYYDGVLVADWETLAAGLADAETVAAALALRLDEDTAAQVELVGSRVLLTAREAGTPFTLSASVTGSGAISTSTLQASAVAVPEVRAQGSFTIVSGTPGAGTNRIVSLLVDGVDLIGSPLDFDTDTDTTAAAIVTRVNGFTSGYTASAVGSVVTVTVPPGFGASGNGRVVSVAVGGDVLAGSISNTAGGADPVAAVAQISEISVDTFDAAALYSVVLNGDAYITLGTYSAMPRTVKTVKQKMYAVVRSLMYFSGFAGTPPVADPTQWINDSATPEVRATASFTITGGTVSAGVNFVDAVRVDGVNTLSGDVDFDTDASTTATAVALAINSGTSGYTAAAVGAVVTLSAPEGDGASANGRVLTVDVAGTVTVGSITNFASGVDEIPPDVFGAGFIDTSTQNGGAQELVGLGIYQDKVAAFSRRTVQLWNVDPDPDLNSIYQVLINVGTVAPETIVEYGDIDIFFLSESGIRSLRARDSSNLANADDVGVAVDTDLIASIEGLTPLQVRDARAVIEPAEGRYLMAVGSRVYVFSNFPGGRVAAWSTYELQGDVSAWAVGSFRLFARIGDTVHLYGGLSGAEYDDSAIVVELPFLDASNPAGMKQFMGFDIGAIGQWSIEMALEPNDTDSWEAVGIVAGSTYGSTQRHSMEGQSTHVAMRFTCTDASKAVLGNAIIHYNDIGAD